MKWYQFTSDKIFSYGKVDHKVWKAEVTGGFYAISGLDNLGHFETAKDAMKACEAYEKEL